MTEHKEIWEAIRENITLINDNSKSICFIEGEMKVLIATISVLVLVAIGILFKMFFIGG